MPPVRVIAARVLMLPSPPIAPCASRVTPIVSCARLLVFGVTQLHDRSLLLREQSFAQDRGSCRWKAAIAAPPLPRMATCKGAPL